MPESQILQSDFKFKTKRSMRRKFILLSLLLVAFVTSKAQDVITQKDGTTLIVKTLEVNNNEIKFKKYSNLEGPTYSISIQDIDNIIYENGEKDIFSENKTKKAPLNTHILKAGTEIPLILPNKVKQLVSTGIILPFETSQDIFADNVLVLPKGTQVQGIVYSSKEQQGYISIREKMGILISKVELPNGGIIPLSDGDLYVTGNFWNPKARMAKGFETIVHTTVDVVVDENGDVVKSIPLSDKAFMNELFTKSLPCPASIVSKSSQTINVLIVGVSNDNVNYVEKKIYNANKESIYFKKVSKSIPIVNIDNIYFHKE